MRGIEKKVKEKEKDYIIGMMVKDIKEILKTTEEKEEV